MDWTRRAANAVPGFRRLLHLQASEQKYRDIVESTTEWIWEIDRHGRLTFTNRAVANILGYTSDELLGRDRSSLMHDDDRGEARTVLQEVIGHKTVWSGWTLRFRHKNGEYRWLESNAVPLIDRAGNLTGYRGTDRDVTDRRAAVEELSRKAHHDPLTELPDRMLFRKWMDAALDDALRESRSVSVLMLDVGGLQSVNETLGHNAGDEVLVEASRRIYDCLLPGSVMARMRGGVFGALVKGETAQAIEIGERIRRTVRKPIRLGEREVFVDVSIGVAESPRGSVQSEAMLRDADAAMYAARRIGGGSVEVYRPELHSQVLERFELVTDLRRALDQEQFILHYQPVVALEDERVVGAEALVRWLRPNRGLVSPADFVPVAEETGMILPLDRWVLRHACTAARSVQERFGADALGSLSVNVSARQLQDADLVRYVAQTLEETDFEPGRLTLEITESILMQDMGAAIRILTNLKTLGIRLAIDDFGIGFSSLSYLRQLPVDVVKIDRSFVAGIATASEEWTLARGIVKLVHGLGLETVAEGVERADQKAHLRALGCRLAQGFYFARPMDATALAEFLEARTSGRAPRDALARLRTEDVAEGVADVVEEATDLAGGVSGTLEC